MGPILSLGCEMFGLLLRTPIKSCLGSKANLDRENETDWFDQDQTTLLIMLPKVVPKHSSIHRYSCKCHWPHGLVSAITQRLDTTGLVLYRALLRQCKRLPPDVPYRETIPNLVKIKFHRYNKYLSPSKSVNALRAGYEVKRTTLVPGTWFIVLTGLPKALDLLHAASRHDDNARNRISTIIEEAQARKRKAQAEARLRGSARPKKPPTPRELRAAWNRQFQNATAVRHPNAEPIWNRPRPIVPGKRHIPVLVNARGVPFLRIKKPQPQSLSRMIRNKLAQRWRYVERRDELEVAILFAKDEDNWDQNVGHAEEATWEAPMREAMDELYKKVAEFDYKNYERGKKLWKIVLAERALAEKEEAERKQKEEAERKQKTKDSEASRSTEVEVKQSDQLKGQP